MKSNIKIKGSNPWPNPNKLCMNLRGAGSEWTAYADPVSGSTYYYNSATQETSWTLPLAANLAGELPVTEKLQTDGAVTTAAGELSAAADGAPQPPPVSLSAAHAVPIPSSAVSSAPPAAAAASHAPGPAAGASAQPDQQALPTPGHAAGGAHHAEVRRVSHHAINQP